MKSIKKTIFTKIYLILYPIICGTLCFIWIGTLSVKIISTGLEISLIAAFYILSALYIFLLYLNRYCLKIHEIILYYLLFIAYLFMSLFISYCWILSIFLLPLSFFIFNKKGKKLSVVLGIITCGVILFAYFKIVPIVFFLKNIKYIKEELHYSPDRKHVAIEYLNDSGSLGGNEWVTLYKNKSPLYVVKVSSLYSNYNYQEDLDVKWIDNKTIYIEGYYIDIEDIEEVVIDNPNFDD